MAITQGCDGVKFKGVDLVPCPKKPQHITDDLRHYCNDCMLIYEKNKGREEPPYNPDEYDGYQLI